MAPLIATLLAKGLNLAANAALEKGTEWVKEKTGVDLEVGDVSDADAEKLREFEVVNEEELTAMMVDNNRIEAELNKAYLEDVQDARGLQEAALDQEDTFSKRFVYYLAMFWSLAAAIYIGCITFLTIPEGNERYADTIIGFLLGTLIAQIFNYFFGSSRGSHKKTDGMLAKLRGSVK
ncbi:hypothetical protein N9112_00175 [bacterium]|nr:hypothetical protein [bacterium]